MATNFEPHKCVIFVQSTKIGTHENKAIHSRLLLRFYNIDCLLEVKFNVKLQCLFFFSNCLLLVSKKQI